MVLLDLRRLKVSFDLQNWPTLVTERSRFRDASFRSATSEDRGDVVIPYQSSRPHHSKGARFRRIALPFVSTWLARSNRGYCTVNETTVEVVAEPLAAVTVTL